MEKKRIRKMRDWCIDCVFKPYGKKYMVSRAKGPTDSQCTECMYDKLRTKKVGKPINYRKGKRDWLQEEKERTKVKYTDSDIMTIPVGKAKIINHDGCMEFPKPIDPEPATPQPSGPLKTRKGWCHCNEHNIDYPCVDDMCPKCEEDSYKPEPGAQKRIIEKRRLNEAECYNCGKIIEKISEPYMFSRPCIVWTRYRCLECGKKHELLPMEFNEGWRNV